MADDHVRRQLQQLLTFPREDLNTELKGWLDLAAEMDRANLGKAILALANSGGGYVLIGYEEAEGFWRPKLPVAVDLNGYGQDAVNNIIRRYADPVFHCEVHHVPHHTLNSNFPVIVVPGNHKSPIRCKADDPERKHMRVHNYYIRRAGPASEPPQNGQEWETLLRRCLLSARDELLEDFRSLIHGGTVNENSKEQHQRASSVRLKQWEEVSRSRWKQLVTQKLPQEQPSRYEGGVWTASYGLFGEFDELSLVDLRRILSDVAGHESGWPPWWIPTNQELAPYVYDGLVECWLKDSHFLDAAHSDFWRASPERMLFLLRGYQEDTELKPQKYFSLTLPIWRVAEIALHAERLARTTGQDRVPICMRFRWEGLSGRVVSAWPTHRSLPEDRLSRQDVVESEILLMSNAISTALPEIVSQVIRPLYEIFDFFEVPQFVIQEELGKMRSSG